MADLAADQAFRFAERVLSPLQQEHWLWTAADQNNALHVRLWSYDQSWAWHVAHVN
jgi:hypothetical protein